MSHYIDEKIDRNRQNRIDAKIIKKMLSKIRKFQLLLESSNF